MVARNHTATLLIASLLWGSGGEGRLAPPLPLRSERGHIITTRMIDSSKSCTTDTDCGDTKLLTCDHEKKHCICREDYHVLSSSGDCLPAKQLGEACAESVQCQLLEKLAVCTNSFCACDSGSYLPHETNGTLCDPDKLAGGNVLRGGGTHLDQNMIIVIAVLAIMFVGICVALHLFSKARFRNRRTIFNSPHPRLMHIKLGKRKKSSIRTQHLPPPPPPGHLVPRHHSFSGHHSPFPMAKVPKTRSHECLRSALGNSSPKFEPRCKTAPLAERESLPSTEELDRKTPLHNGPASLLGDEESLPQAPGSPTVIITDADGSHTVVSNPASPAAHSSAAVSV